MSFRRILWGHKPLTDFWRIGPGIARKLEQNGMFTLGDVAKMSVTKHPVVVHIEKPKKNENAVQTMKNGEDLLYKLFGINAELIIDHAWGWEPCTVDVIKQYRPENNSLGSGQVLHEPYTFDKARIIVMEMADELSMSLVRKGLATERIELYIGFDRESLTEDHGLYRYKDGRIYKGAVTADPYGRPHPKHANGNFKLDFPTSSTKLIIDAAVSIFEQKVDKGLLVRRVGVTACNVIPKQEAERIRRERQEAPEQLNMFTDYDSLAAEKEAQEKKLEREKRLQEAMLTIKDKFGKNAVLKGLNYQEGARGRERNNEVGGHKA